MTSTPAIEVEGFEKHFGDLVTVGGLRFDTAPVRRSSPVSGKTLGGATVAAVQGTIMLAFAPLIGVHLTYLLVIEVIALELVMSIAITAFGVFVASRIQRIEGFQVVMQLVLFPMLFLSGALFPLDGLPGWLTVLTRINPLTYAVAPLRQVVFAVQKVPSAAAARFSAPVTMLGHVLSIWTELGVVVVFFLVFFLLAAQGFSKRQ